MAPATTTSPLDIQAIAAEFPILSREWGGNPLTYLDSAATAQTPEPVIEAMDAMYREHNANIHRGVYPLAQEATEAFEGARGRLARFIGAASKEVVFTKNATEAINLVAYAWGRRNVGAGDRIVISEMEHHSNIVPWQLCAAERGAELVYVPIDEHFGLDMEALDAELERGASLVSVAHVSNVLGTVNPVAEIVRRAHAAGAKVLIDGAQAAPHLRLDMHALGADFYVFTGHKVYGPTGIGVLFGRRDLLEEMPPFLSGGDMIAKVDWQQSTWNELPWKFEAGTSPYVEAVGLGTAVEWLDALGLEAIEAWEHELTGYALERLEEIPGLTILGPSAGRARGTAVSFAIEGVHPHDVAELLARQGVCIRAGHHCAQPLMRRLGVAATSRASIAVHTTHADIDRLIDGLAEVRNVFGLD